MTQHTASTALSDPLTLARKRVLVTGAGTGIGEGIALELARRGAFVVLHDALPGERAEENAQAINDAGGKALAVRADLSDPNECVRVVQKATDFLDGLDVLVNNAGVTRRAALLETTSELFDALFGVNVRGTYFMTQAAVRALLANDGERAGGRGAIINLASIHGQESFAGMSVYAATKGAIAALTRQLSAELAPDRIRVNAIAPGHIEVDRHRANPTYSPDTARANSPWNRVGTPDDTAHLCAFLASDASWYLSGQVIGLDGGKSARQPMDNLGPSVNAPLQNVKTE